MKRARKKELGNYCPLSWPKSRGRRLEKQPTFFSRIVNQQL